MSTKNTIVLEESSMTEAHAVKVPSRLGATKGSGIEVTPRIFVFESTGSVRLDNLAISSDTFEYLLSNAESIKVAIKTSKIKRALKTLGVSSKEELLDMLK